MKSLVALLLMTTCAFAEEPSQEVKTQMLKRAYELNGNSMVGWGSIDMTAPRPVKTEVILPEKAVVPDTVADTAPNTCETHGLKLVFSHDGKSWHCKRH